MIKVGDLVLAHGQNGVFIVRELWNAVAEIELFNLSKQRPTGYKICIPHNSLSPFKDDASHAAARIVREETRD